MNLVAAIQAFNKSSKPPIKLLATRDGRTVAKLPRVAREIVVKETNLNNKVKVTPQGIAWLCEEARLASAPGMACWRLGSLRSARWREKRKTSKEATKWKSNEHEIYSTREGNSMNRHNWKLVAIALMVVILALSEAAAQKTNIHGAGVASEDHPNTHNMLVVGKEAAYLSHLPMFDELNKNKTDYTSPHRYQVILKVSFTLDGKDVTDIYTRDRKSHAETKMYTLEPASKFVLARLFTPDAQKPALSSFHATVFRGHLERGGKPIDGLSNVVVTVKKVLHAQKFEPSQDKPKKLQYFLFGKGEELFLAHSIIKPPDFDQILSVKVTGHQFADEELNSGVAVVIADKRNTATQRLKENQKTQGQFHITGAHQFLNLQVQSGTELYFEEGELAMPAKFNQTREERKAGF